MAAVAERIGNSGNRPAAAPDFAADNLEQAALDNPEPALVAEAPVVAGNPEPALVAGAPVVAGNLEPALVAEAPVAEAETPELAARAEPAPYQARHSAESPEPRQ
jgi:hypothetical protein